MSVVFVVLGFFCAIVGPLKSGNVLRIRDSLIVEEVYQKVGKNAAKYIFNSKRYVFDFTEAFIMTVLGWPHCWHFGVIIL
jgi:hypothetical protein